MLRRDMAVLKRIGLGRVSAKDAKWTANMHINLTYTLLQVVNKEMSICLVVQGRCYVFPEDSNERPNCANGYHSSASRYEYRKRNQELDCF